MTFLRFRIGLVAAVLLAGLMIIPASAQAQCNGGSCSITGGSLRTTVGGGFIIPQVPEVNPFLGAPAGPLGQMGYAGALTQVITPTFGMTFTVPVTCFGSNCANTARGAVLPVPGAAVTVPSGQTFGPPPATGNPSPYSINIPLKQMTYGSAPANGGGYYTTPILVQVPLFPFAPALMGVSTNIGQSFPGETRTFMNGPSTTTFLGGPVNLKAGGRGGAATVTYCAGANVPRTVGGEITGAWTGSCTGFTPVGQSQIAPALVRYTKTANQFGGVATQRQVRRDNPTTTNNWLGRINFNNFASPYTVNDMAMVSIPKIYPTLPQNLVEPAVWGATFGATLRREGATAQQGDLVSGSLTPAGAPVNTATQLPTVPSGTGMGLVQTSTSWGGPLTTGRVTVQNVPPPTFMAPPSTWTQTGNDQRTPGGQGMLNLVSGSISSRTLSGPGTQRTFLTLELPEPSMAFGLLVGCAALVGVSRRRSL